MTDQKKWPRSEVYVLKRQLRYLALRKLQVPAREADRAAQSVVGFTRTIEALGLSLEPYADIIKREPPSRPSTTDPKRIAKRIRRRHLRALGIDPERANWIAERPRQYRALMLQIGAEDACST